MQHIEQGVYHYRRGDACLLGRNAQHWEVFDSPFHIVFLNMSPLFLRNLLDSDEIQSDDGSHRLADGVIRRFLRQELDGSAAFERGYLDFTPTLAAPKAVEQTQALLDRLGEELLQQQPGSNLLLRGYLARLFGILEDPGKYHAVHMRPESRTEDMLVARVSNYLRERDGRVSREQLAEALHYHPTYLNQLVKARTGKSILQLGQGMRRPEGAGAPAGDEADRGPGSPGAGLPQPYLFLPHFSGRDRPHPRPVADGKHRIKIDKPKEESNHVERSEHRQVRGNAG